MNNFLHTTWFAVGLVGITLTWCSTFAEGKTPSDRSGATTVPALMVEKKFPGDGRYLAFSPSGDRLASGWPTLGAIVWSLPTGKEAARLSLSDEHGPAMCVSRIHFSPDGKWLVTGSLMAPGEEKQGLTGQDHRAYVWDANSGGLRMSLEGHSNFVYSAACSADGKRIITASRDRSIDRKSVV